MEQARNEHKDKFLDQIREIVGKHQRFAIFSHEVPDGDAIGSQIALTLALRKLGKEVVSLRIDPIPISLEFLDRENIVEQYRPARDRERLNQTEVAIVLDSCNYFRLGELAGLVADLPAIKINIDHHRDNTFFGKINFVRFIAGGTAELVFEVIKALGVPVKGTIAEALYVGLSTDTVGFRYIDPDGNMINVIAELIKGGIDVGDLQEKIYCNRPETYLDDLAHLLGRVRYEKDGALAWFIMSTSDYLTFYERELASEALKQLLSIKNIRAALMIHEEKEGVEVWLRSKADVDVGKAAEAIGGGGHRTASGALLRGMKLKDATRKVLLEVKEAFPQNG